MTYVSITEYYVLLDRRQRVAKERGYFDGEQSMVDGTTDVGNFHVKVKQEQYDNAVEQSSFEVLIKRIIKINTSLD